MLEAFSFVWNEGILRPMLNTLVLMYSFLGNFGVTILLFTVLVRLLTMPLTLRQMRQARAMSTLSPKLQALKQKYANNRQELSRETMKLYREQGVNPIGCLGPMVIQMPIWIGLYRSVILALPTTPENLMGLSQRLYGWLPAVDRVVPLNSQFLVWDLARPDTTFILPVLVGASMWVMQKMMTFHSADQRQQQTQQMMLWMMPLFMAFISFQFPSGLALYIFASNIIGMAIQYPVTGWGSLFASRVAQPAVVSPPPDPDKEVRSDGEGRQHRSDREERRGGHGPGPKRARRRSRGGRGRHT